MRRPRTSHPALVVGSAAVAAALVRLPLLTVPLSSDEAGFLLVAHQWSPGRSLYGDYWVDRPPGLVELFVLAGGVVGLRLLGLLAAVGSVLLAAVLARTVSPDRRWAPAATAGLVAALVSSRLLDVTVVDGELLALPFLLGGLVCALRAAFATRNVQRLAWGVAAGSAGAAAMSVKQNLADVVVVLIVLALALVLRRRPAAAVALVASASAGASVVTGGVLLLAWSHGTTPGALWDAVVLFRLRAAEVLADPTGAASHRARELLLALVATGAPLVLLLLPRVVRRRPVTPGRLAPGDPLVGWAAVALVGWELVSVAAGGSFWLHYLVGVVPGLALVLALASGAVPPAAPATRRLLPAAVGVVVASSLVGLVGVLVEPHHRPPAEAAVAAYLRQHAHQGRTAVTTLGRPTILREAGMSSPYPMLWSLPMRVDDPGLRSLTPLLQHERAQWVLVNPVAMRAWGLSSTRAERVLARHYRPAFRSGHLVVWRADRPGTRRHMAAL